MPRALLAAVVLALAAPVAAQAATLTTDRPCYVDAEGQLIDVTGAGFAPASEVTVTGAGITETQTPDAAGGFAFDVGVPDVAERFKPRKLTLVARQDGEQVAKVGFKVVQFLVQPKSVRGNPTRETRWDFAGFTPGKPIYVHVKRGSKTYTEKAGKGDRQCGTLKTRLPRLPAVPGAQIKFGKYRVFVDNRRKFRRGGLQFRATITIVRR